MTAIVGCRTLAQHHSSTNLAPTGRGSGHLDEITCELRWCHRRQVNVHPNGNGFDSTATLTLDQCLALGPMRPEATAPCVKGELFLEHRKLMDPHCGASHHPAVAVGVGRLAGVVVGDVLEVPHGGVQTQTASRRDIPQPNPPSGPKNPSGGRKWRKFKPHGARFRSWLGHIRTLIPGVGVKSVDVEGRTWFPTSRMLFAHRAQASARHAAAMAAYWHATQPVFAATFTNKRPSQRPDRSPT